MTELVLGPLVRYVSHTSATVWVETPSAGTVTVTAGAHRAQASTFGVHGHHYALVDVTGLEPGSRPAYTVEFDGERLWPPPHSEFPPSVLATLEPGKPLRLAFGSCRTSVPHDEQGNASHGIDALRAYAFWMAGEAERFPDLVLFLGDQVYADETPDDMREFISARRDITEPPWMELKDYEEYAHLYKIAWSDPANRWLLSTLPSAMIFDDHDIRDDWNTSLEWKREMEATPWWHGRIVAGLASYWVYQHLGNLPPEERSRDPVWRQVLEYDGPAEMDLSTALDAFAERVDREPDSYRWSYARDLEGGVRLVVVDSRAARVLDPARRAMLDDRELAWLDAQLVGGVEHLLVGTSLPFLLSPGLHHVEALSEALAGGAWGQRGARWVERIRRAVDLEQWAAFQTSFQKVSSIVLAVARGERGPAPRTITFLSGDVHHSYLTEAWPRLGPRAHSRILQAVCSPIRNPLPRAVRMATAGLSYGLAGPVGHALTRSAKVPRPALRWRQTQGPWFDNCLATLELTDGGLRIWWSAGAESAGKSRPRLVRLATVDIDATRVAALGRKPSTTG